MKYRLKPKVAKAEFPEHRNMVREAEVEEGCEKLAEAIREVAARGAA